jgi:dCMP deaminase
MYIFKEHKIKFFLELADMISTQSPDPATKCGTILTDNEGRIVSTGYNGFAKNTNNENWPTTRPEKYSFVVHSEENAIINANVILRHIGGGVAFVNRQCCQLCLIKMHNFGVHTVYQTNRKFTSIDEQAIEKVIKETGIKTFFIDLD